GTANESSVFNPGEYTVTLTVTDNNGCTASQTVEVTVGELLTSPTGVFDNDDDHTPLPDHFLCAQDTISFWLPDWENEDYEYTWWVDSTSNQDPSQEYTDHAYDQDTGFVYLHLITDNNGCIDTTLKETFYISGPIINSISNEYDCLSPRDYQFELNALLAEYWDWAVYYYPDPDTQTFIENVNNSTDEIFPYTFPPTPDSFWVRVTAYNDTTGCVFVDSVQITITAPSADFNFANYDNCANVEIEFNGSGSQNVGEYYWDFGDGVETGWVSTSIVNHTFTTVGVFDVWLKVRNSNGCLDSVMHSIHIIGPEIHVDISDSYGCNSLEVTFTDNSIADEAIVSPHWDFGDGDNQSGSTVTHLYDEPGVYSVTIYLMTQPSGCPGEMTFTDTITVAQVSAAFTTPDLAACIDDDIVFSSVETNTAYTYTWNFGDGSADVVGHQTVISHSYDAGGRYDVYLEVDNGLGCVSELLLENYITIEAPTADFSLGSNYLSCYPAPAVITVNNSVIPAETVLSYSWVFGSGEPILLEEPAYLFTMPGTFDIVLTITTPAGCTSTHTESITVDGPYAEATISDTTACVGQEIDFALTNMIEVEDFQWVVGGGDSYDVESFTHSYDLVPPEGYFPVNLLLWSGGCEVSFVYNVYIFDVTAGIVITDTASNVIVGGLCSPFEGILTSNSSNDDYRDWFINGSPVGSGGSSESYIFENNGATDQTVTISLAIEDVNTCVDTATITIDVYALPQVTISSDTTICKGDAISIYADGGVIYQWSPNEAISETNVQSPTVNPENDITYFVDVYNARNCMSSDSVHIIVQQDFDVTVTPAIDSIIIGDTVYSVLVATQENLTYSWSPTDFASCVDCPMPYFIPEESTRYTVTVEDSSKCFRYSFYIDIVVREEYTLDVPGAFTPLSANGNSVVYADGFGIRKLLQFRIYNRWGEEVFYTDDITKGWNGYYNGQLQNIDTYSYYVEAEMFDGTTQSKKGHIMLIR
ncbi:MAG: PKD domain-containing protein, partial [Bacteroidales bacterium]|nr:PKD domain-containing protein [Bacteroidales bacterium]